MADGQISRPKRQGNYVPERIRATENEVAARYELGESARELARIYGISKIGVRGVIERNGLQWRNVSEAEANDPRSVARQVAEKLGSGTSAELSYDQPFRSACARENRRRNVENRRELEKRRKIPEPHPEVGEAQSHRLIPRNG